VWQSHEIEYKTRTFPWVGVTLVALGYFKFFEDATQNLKVLVNNIFDRKWSGWHTLMSTTDKIIFWAGGTD